MKIKLKALRVLAIPVMLSCLLLMAGVAGSGLGQADGYRDRGPIYISGDDEFTADNGVLRGKGTVDDPYIIAAGVMAGGFRGWRIIAAGGLKYGIKIENTRAHFKIVNCLVQNIGERLASGIVFNNVRNGQIVNCRILDNYDGIFLYRSRQNFLSDNLIAGNKDNGISLSESAGNEIRRNSVTGNGRQGIFAWHSDGNVFAHNLIANSGRDGMYLDSSAGNRVSGNRIVENQDYGLFLWDCPDHRAPNHIIGNIITKNDTGMALVHTSADNFSYHNRFIANRLNACDEGVNYWDAGYPTGGNYWDDYNGVDRHNGPAQDEDGPDGLGDSFYAIPCGDNSDRYPLMK